MLLTDRLTIIASLELLNEYIEKDLKQTKENIEYWTKRVEEYGEDYVAHPELSDETYAQILNMSLVNKKYFKGRLDENKRIIEMLKKGGEGKDETD